ncbi:hypothetical protein J6590_008835 [Homalodisca vitripennis]|nr:hypothetical protein J6590_008835 [Homalodisca vitripennis]
MGLTSERPVGDVRLLCGTATCSVNNNQNNPQGAAPAGDMLQLFAPVRWPLAITYKTSKRDRRAANLLYSITPTSQDPDPFPDSGNRTIRE